MREAWKLVADYYVALKGTISVRVRRADPSVRIAGATAIVALALMGLHWFNSTGDGDDGAAESAGAVGSTQESPHVDEGPTAAAARPHGSSPSASGSAGLARSRDSSGAIASDGGAEPRADDPRSLAERDDGTASTSASFGPASSASSPSNASSTPSSPSSEAEQPASQPSADAGTEPGQQCDPGTGLVTGLVGGLVCLVDDVL